MEIHACMSRSDCVRSVLKGNFKRSYRYSNNILEYFVYIRICTQVPRGPFAKIPSALYSNKVSPRFILMDATVLVRRTRVDVAHHSFLVPHLAIFHSSNSKDSWNTHLLTTCAFPVSHERAHNVNYFLSQLTLTCVLRTSTTAKNFTCSAHGFNFPQHYTLTVCCASLTLTDDNDDVVTQGSSRCNSYHRPSIY